MNTIIKKMIYKKWKVEIKDYITHVKLSNSRRTVYYKKGDKIPKKYQKDLDFDKKGIAINKTTKEKIVKNTKTAGTPKLWKINFNQIYSGNLHQHSRAKVVKELHEYFCDEFLKTFEKDYKIRVSEDKRLLFTYTFYGKVGFNENGIDTEGTADLSNLSYLYVKSCEDSLTEYSKNNPDSRNNRKLELIKDDTLRYITNIFLNFVEANERKLEICIYLIPKNFNINELLDKNLKNG